MKTIKAIIECGGYILESQIDELTEHFPNMPVVIKWEQSAREIIPIKDLKEKIKQKESRGDYAREVFISAKNLDLFHEVFGI